MTIENTLQCILCIHIFFTLSSINFMSQKVFVITEDNLALLRDC